MLPLSVRPYMTVCPSIFSILPTELPMPLLYIDITIEFWRMRKHPKMICRMRKSIRMKSWSFRWEGGSAVTQDNTYRISQNWRLAIVITTLMITTPTRKITDTSPTTACVIDALSVEHSSKNSRTDSILELKKEVSLNRWDCEWRARSH